MFSFFHRTPEIHLDCFTDEVEVYHNTPIIYTSRSTPDWWRKLPSGFKPDYGPSDDGKIAYKNRNRNAQTAKDCYAIIEFYKKGISLPCWCDFAIKVDYDDMNYCWSCGPAPKDHAREQLGAGFPFHNHLKLNSPWHFYEKTGIKFMWVGDDWSLHNHLFKVLPAITSFKMNSSTNVNIMIPKLSYEFEITIGTPLVHMVPITEKKLTFKNHLLSKQEFVKVVRNGANQSFYGWRKILKIQEKMSEQEKKCPFGFGK